VKDVAFGTSAATKDRANAGQQFRNDERFGDEVIRASIQGADAVFDRGFSGNEDEGCIGPAPLKETKGIASWRRERVKIKQNQIEHFGFSQFAEVLQGGKHVNSEILFLEPGF
jgi:hypothetical protein